MTNSINISSLSNLTLQMPVLASSTFSETQAVISSLPHPSTGTDLPLMNSESSLIDFDVQITTGDWIPWQSKVPSIEINANAVTSSDIVVPTMDTAPRRSVVLLVVRAQASDALRFLRALERR